eukprot:7858020-Alexandrium_andersonii.AAC.1
MWLYYRQCWCLAAKDPCVLRTARDCSWTRAEFRIVHLVALAKVRAGGVARARLPCPAAKIGAEFTQAEASCQAR